MKVLIDDNIPYIREAAARLFDKVSYAGGALFRQSGEIDDADALIIRTRTKCNRSLLEGTRVKFIATATIGYDHIDTAYLAEAGIGWTNCPGCNAASVAQYVRNALYLVCQKRGIRPSALTVGIVGWGHVGKQVDKALTEAGFRTLLNDPPLQEAGVSPSFAGQKLQEADGSPAHHDLPQSSGDKRKRTFVSLSTLARECDVITFHTPLTTVGAHPTFHLADAAFFNSLERQPVIINAARGGVVDEHTLLISHARGQVSDMIIDTWEGEPHINHNLLERAFIATPHVAGYSADGKSNATRMALRAVCRHFDIPISDESEFLRLTAAPPLPPEMHPTGDIVADNLLLYNPLDDTARLKSRPTDFEHLRGAYPLRREMF